MPMVGLGTWKIPKAVCADVVHTALKLGYRHLDCACDYGNEKEVGEGLARAIKAGDVTREDVFVTSKLWNTFHKAEHVAPAFKRSLTDLGLEYMDLYLIHFPLSLKYVDPEVRYPPEWTHDPTAEKPEMIFEPVPLRETWQALEQLVDEGLVRHIGVANFPNALLMDLLSYARVKPAVNQVEIHPYLQQPGLVRYNEAAGVVVTSYSNFGGLSYEAFNATAKATPSLLNGTPAIQKIAESHGKSTAQVILRWCTQRNLIVIPKSLNEARLKQNLELFDFTLTEEEMSEIAKLERGLRFNNPGVYANYPIFD